MNTIIISDLHLGSEFCKSDDIIRFLSNLEPDATLILNGDTVSQFDCNLTEKHYDILDLIRKESLSRKVIWIRGNHDKSYELTNPENIEFHYSWTIDNKIHITHGFEYDHIRAACAPLTRPLYYLHKLRIKLGAKPTHISLYVKALSWFYTPYKHHFANTAMKQAQANGFSTVICGHIHCAGEYEQDGIRYLNTGSWVESPTYYILISKDNIELKEVNFE